MHDRYLHLRREMMPDALEARLGVKIRPHHDVIARMTEYPAVLLNRFSISKGNKGKFCGLEFGERLHFR